MCAYNWDNLTNIFKFQQVYFYILTLIALKFSLKKKRRRKSENKKSKKKKTEICLLVGKILSTK